uniref:Uncharacterized protein n=1 Tax=Strigamia maritima TaxID=126957 RepID=T1IGY6_STRMM
MLFLLLSILEKRLRSQDLELDRPASNTKMELESFTSDNKSSEKCSCCQNKKDIDVSIPGLGRLMDPAYGKKSKLLWMLIVLCCTVACVYLTINRLVHYFNIPLATKVEVRRLHSVNFPAFTVCSNNLLNGLKPLVKLKVQEECLANFRSECGEELENLSLHDLNISLYDVWKPHVLTDIEINLVGLEHTIQVKEYLQNNKTFDEFEFTAQDTILGSCVVIRHIGTVPYLSTATSLTVTIHETLIDPNSKLAYIFIPHGTRDELLTKFEFLLNEFEEFPAGYEFKLKLHEENFHLKNTVHKVCYDQNEEIDRMKECAVESLRSEVCRLPGCPDSYRECESLNDLPEFDTHLNSYWVGLSADCQLRPVCNDQQYIILVDTTIVHRDKEKTTIIIRMTDDTIDVVEQVIAYTFPDLVSDLFAYWSFFLSLSALVFAEIFEYLFKKLRECITKNCTR